MRVAISIFVSILTVSLYTFFIANPASADQIEYDWVSGEPSVAGGGSTTGPISRNCRNEKVYLSNASLLVNDNEADICVVEKGNWRYGQYSYTPPGSSTVERGLAVGFGVDRKMYRMEFLQGAEIINTTHPNALVYLTQAGGTYAHNLSIIKDLPLKLDRVAETDGTIRYRYDGSAPDFVLRRPNQAQITVQSGVEPSRDGKWIIAHAIGIGTVRINVETYGVRRISNFEDSGENGSQPGYAFAVTEDGKRVAVATTGYRGWVHTFYVADECGDTITDTTTSTTPISNPCASRNVTQYAIDKGYPSYFDAIGKPEFSDDAGKLIIHGLAVKPPELPTGGIILTAPAYTSPKPLDYLAMGDSYSSGEGDVDKKSDGSSYYTPQTSMDGGCHISTRSYPYRLSTWMSLDAFEMKSVACSGAKVDDMKFIGSSYLGQGDRLKGLSFGELTNKRSDALINFVPGRVEQIRFVSRYKPKAVTLTAGGNNVDFGGKLQTCAKSKDTCKWTSGAGRSQLGYEIQKEFYELRDFYLSLKKTSSNTKVYVVSYPTFINPESWRHCTYDDGYLNASEKAMIDEATKYMNMTIRNAAVAAGVVYLNVEDSLNGGRICDFGGEYVSGQADIQYSEDDYLRMQTFHPNSRGHKKIFETIQQKLQGYTLLSHPYTQTEYPSVSPPPPTSYFGDAMAAYPNEKGAQSTKMTKDAIKKGSPYAISTNKYMFQGRSSIGVKLYSDPVSLGDLTAEEDGSLGSSITIPTNMPAGYHTLELRGVGYSGEPIILQQTILVTGQDASDMDENGVLDAEQPCGPFSLWTNTDIDMDGIDDGCDYYIYNIWPAYRLRAGSADYDYQGSSEKTEYVYLERNVHAESITGIGGDYDLDDNGYAIIAATQGATPSGYYASLQADTTTHPNSVYVNFRTQEDGCVKYEPTDTSLVTSISSYRTFTQVGVNTSTCRNQGPSDDLDSNSQPDNTQPLYSARNGDPAYGEDPAKLYIFRSTRAAEAQLGISDYAPFISSAPSPIPVDDPTDYRQAWSLLASTQSKPAVPVTFKKIHMVGTTPYVLTTTANLVCQAYKPASIATIKKSTQPTTNLTLDVQQTLNAQLGGWCGQ